MDSVFSLMLDSDLAKLYGVEGDSFDEFFHECDLFGSEIFCADQGQSLHPRDLLKVKFE